MEFTPGESSYTENNTRTRSLKSVREQYTNYKVHYNESYIQCVTWERWERAGLTRCSRASCRSPCSSSCSGSSYRPRSGNILYASSGENTQNFDIRVATEWDFHSKVQILCLSKVSLRLSLLTSELSPPHISKQARYFNLNALFSTKSMSHHR